MSSGFYNIGINQLAPMEGVPSEVQERIRNAREGFAMLGPAASRFYKTGISGKKKELVRTGIEPIDTVANNIVNMASIGSMLLGAYALQKSVTVPQLLRKSTT